MREPEASLFLHLQPNICLNSALTPSSVRTYNPDPKSRNDFQGSEKRNIPMKKLLVGLAMCVLAWPGNISAQAPAQAAAPASAAPAQAAPQGRKKRVAIMDFDYATVRTDAAAFFGSDVDVGKGIADLLVTDLVKDGTYSVIERQQLDKILAEQNFSNSDRANPASAAKMGKLLGVDAIIVGAITQFGNETKNTGAAGGGGSFGGFGLGGFSHKKSKAIVGMNARIVNVDTGEIMAVAEGKGESSRESTSLGGGGGSWHGFGAGGVNFGSSDFQNTIIGEAVKAASDQMSSELIADNSKVETRTISVEGLVAAVTGGQVVLNVGKKAGLKVGDQLTIERVTMEIKDPATGQVIRRLSSQIGTIELTDVDDISAVGKILTGSDFKVGDLAKTITQ
jgi:curli biogenesis system outer membrane secretion channel CsgG